MNLQRAESRLMRTFWTGFPFGVMLVASSDVQPFYERFEFAPYPDVMAQLNWRKLFDLTTDRGGFRKGSH